MIRNYCHFNFFRCENDFVVKKKKKSLAFKIHTEVFGDEMIGCLELI